MNIKELYYILFSRTARRIKIDPRFKVILELIIDDSLKSDTNVNLSRYINKVGSDISMEDLINYINSTKGINDFVNIYRSKISIISNIKTILKLHDNLFSMTTKNK